MEEKIKSLYFYNTLKAKSNPTKMIFTSTFSNGERKKKNLKSERKNIKLKEKSEEKNC